MPDAELYPLRLKDDALREELRRRLQISGGCLRERRHGLVACMRVEHTDFPHEQWCSVCILTAALGRIDRMTQELRCARKARLTAYKAAHDERRRTVRVLQRLAYGDGKDERCDARA